MIKKPKLLLLLLILLCANLTITAYLRKQNKKKEDEFIKKVARETVELNLQGSIRK